MNELYKISGTVIHGENRGKSLGFPTANIRLDNKVSEGIYAGSVTINGKIYYTASFVGAPKTFHTTDVKLENFIFDFDGDLYGKSITIRLYKKIRDNKKFISVDDLVKQMHHDVEEIKVFFASNS
ncbi:MAG TPA: riboflavin kinase [Candidatus Sulfotelmatobacter sp.]|jgi:riboflavin kinase/FMN adenylyltransferase|nr:riboflavin kinase [Candidatus Sulfotelmatobacter sp.]